MRRPSEAGRLQTSSARESSLKPELRSRRRFAPPLAGRLQTLVGSYIHIGALPSAWASFRSGLGPRAFTDCVLTRIARERAAAAAAV
jgi:hypothetical protein